MSNFKFIDYSFDPASKTVFFRYEGPNSESFQESVTFQKMNQNYNREALDRALSLCFYLVGTSYYKAFPTQTIDLPAPIDQWQADFLNKTYQEGLAQFALENGLTRDDLPRFYATGIPKTSTDYTGNGILSLQSGGKDSLLTTARLTKMGKHFTPWFLASGPHHPKILDGLGEPLVIAERHLDREALAIAAEKGGKNGHIPITYVIQSLAIAQAILLGLDTVLVSIGREGNEPHAHIGDLPVNHQWSKTWEAEQLFAEYVKKYISPNIRIGSALRAMSELLVTREFVKEAWDRWGHRFSSCNVANYRQHSDNSELKWCGNCPKCANMFILLSPFLEPDELKSLFEGQDLFAKPTLEHSFKGLLGIDGIMKPFECVGEVAELRRAYHMRRPGYSDLPFTVADSEYDYEALHDNQTWARDLIYG